MSSEISVFNLKNNQGNQDSSGNQENVIVGQRPDMKNRHIQQRTLNVTYKEIQ